MSSITFKKIIVLSLTTLLSLNCYANTEQKALDSVSLKALPTICLDQDFRSLAFNNEDINKSTAGSFEETLLVSQQAFDQHKSPKKSSKKRSLKTRLKQYLYAVLNEKLNINVNRFTKVRANKYLRFELEPNFTSRGHFESIELTAILFE